MIFKVRNRIITGDNAVCCVGDNRDYIAHFDLDDEWNGVTATARFVKSGKGEYVECVLDENRECVIPVEIIHCDYVGVGVYSSQMTTTEWRFYIRPSIKYEGGNTAPPTPNVYEQVLERMDTLEERIPSEVEEYFVAHPEQFKGDKGEPGSDAEVTVENITNALGYTPADNEAVASKSSVANAVKGVAKGSTIRIDDVSPISHAMAVKVKAKNLIPYPYTAFVEAGSNEVTINGVTFTNNGDGTITANGTATATTNLVLYDLADENRLKFNNSSLVLSGSIGGQVGRNKYYYLKMTAYQADGTETNVLQYSGSTKLPNGCSSSSKLQIVIISGKTVTNVVFKPQLEYGTTKTDYEAPIGDVTALKVIQKNADDAVVAEYTPNSDGTVGGVTSLYPTTVLTTDKGTVPIECEYNRDTNKAITKLYRHSITIWKPIQTYDSEGNIIYGTANFSFKLAVYRSTADSLTLDDIDSHELSGVNGSFNYEDTPEGAAIVYNVRYVSSSKTLTVVYYSDITTASTTSMDFDQYNHNVSDTVTEV